MLPDDRAFRLWIIANVNFAIEPAIAIHSAPPSSAVSASSFSLQASPSWRPGTFSAMCAAQLSTTRQADVNPSNTSTAPSVSPRPNEKGMPLPVRAKDAAKTNSPVSAGAASMSPLAVLAPPMANPVFDVSAPELSANPLPSLTAGEVAGCASRTVTLTPPGDLPVLAARPSSTGSLPDSALTPEGLRGIPLTASDQSVEEPSLAQMLPEILGLQNAPAEDSPRDLGSAGSLAVPLPSFSGDSLKQNDLDQCSTLPAPGIAIESAETAQLTVASESAGADSPAGPTDALGPSPKLDTLPIKFGSASFHTEGQSPAEKSPTPVDEQFSIGPCDVRFKPSDLPGNPAPSMPNSQLSLQPSDPHPFAAAPFATFVKQNLPQATISFTSAPVLPNSSPGSSPAHPATASQVTNPPRTEPADPSSIAAFVQPGAPEPIPNSSAAKDSRLDTRPSPSPEISNPDLPIRAASPSADKSQPVSPGGQTSDASQRKGTAGPPIQVPGFPDASSQTPPMPLVDSATPAPAASDATTGTPKTLNGGPASSPYPSTLPATAEPVVASSPGPVQMAHLVSQAAQSEMRIGLNTAAFGSVEVRTVVHANDVGLLIGSEKGDLRGLLSSELPVIAQSLQQHDLRLNQVSFHQQGFAFSNQMSSGSDSQPRSFTSGRHTNSMLRAESLSVELNDNTDQILPANGRGLSILA